MRTVLALLLILLVVCGGVFIYAGRIPGPTIAIAKPERLVGVVTPVEVSVTAPGGKLLSLHVYFEQNGTTSELASFDGATAAGLAHAGTDIVTVAKEISRDAVPGLKSGQAQLRVVAVRPTLFGLRQASAEATRPLQVRLEKPTISVVSTHHYLNVCGWDLVV
jgi:hypothetical protein